MASSTSLFSEPEAIRMDSFAPSVEYVELLPSPEPSLVDVPDASFDEPHPANKPTIIAMAPAIAPSLRAFILRWPSVHFAPKNSSAHPKTRFECAEKYSVIAMYCRLSPSNQHGAVSFFLCDAHAFLPPYPVSPPALAARFRLSSYPDFLPDPSSSQLTVRFRLPTHPVLLPIPSSFSSRYSRVCDRLGIVGRLTCPSSR